MKKCIHKFELKPIENGNIDGKPINITTTVCLEYCIKCGISKSELEESQQRIKDILTFKKTRARIVYTIAKLLKIDIYY
jgi:hypothetical protein